MTRRLVVAGAVVVPVRRYRCSVVRMGGELAQVGVVEREDYE